MDKNTIDIVIYHANCPDGFGSALSAYIYFKNKKEIEFYPAFHNTKPPNVKNKNVLICDFSYKKNEIMDMICDTNSLLIIDHHKTAEIELENIPDEYKIFDMAHSGAYLTWKYFFPEGNVPLLIQYIEDNDIWKKELPNTLEITAYISTLPFEFDKYEELLDNNNLNKIIPTGEIILKQNNKIVDKTVDGAFFKFILLKQKIYLVGFANSTILQSDIGNRLVLKYPYIDFSVIYVAKDNLYHCSLRSTNDNVDVSTIATIFNGGGHRNASACVLYNELSLGRQIGDNTLYQILDKLDYELGEYNYVKLNLSTNIEYMCLYLMDYKNKKNQNCYSILKHTKNLEYTIFNFVIVWYYKDNTIYYCCASDNKFDIKKIYDKCINFKNENGLIKFEKHINIQI